MAKRPRFLLAVLAVALAAVLPDAAFAQGEAKSNRFWWPEQLDLGPLRQHAPEVRSAAW